MVSRRGCRLSIGKLENVSIVKSCDMVVSYAWWRNSESFWYVGTVSWQNGLARLYMIAKRGSPVLGSELNREGSRSG